jgi:hypothetical protein
LSVLSESKRTRSYLKPGGGSCHMPVRSRRVDAGLKPKALKESSMQARSS